MNLKALALIVCCMTVPAMAAAQGTTKKDTMDMKKHEDMKKHDMDVDKSDNGVKTRTRARGSRRSARGMEMNNSQMNRDHQCARGCPTSAGVGGLSGVQFLALQQELRDRGCGNNHVTGVLDGPTRAAIRTCAAKLNVAATPAAVLTAMNIGYTVGS